MSARRAILRQRAGLVAPFTLAVTLAGVVATLAALFPSQQRLSSLSRQRQFDPLSIVYLQVLLRTHPNDPGLQQALARNFAARGEWDKALDVFMVAAGKPGREGKLARRAALESYLSMEKSLPATARERALAKRDMGQLFERLREETSGIDELLWLAQFSAAMGMQESSAAVYQSLATADAAHWFHWTGLAADRYLAAGAPLRAAQVLEQASVAQGAGSEREACLTRALDAYLAADAGARALRLSIAAAARQGRDRPFLRRASAIALMQGAPKLAQRWGRQLLALAPGDAEAMARQADIELAAGDLVAALQLEQALLARFPHDIERHARIARIADWSGRPELALQHWTVVARRRPSAEATERALSIASGLELDRAWLDIAQLATQQRPLQPQELDAFKRIMARGIEAGRVQQFLADYARRHPQQAQAVSLLRQARAAKADPAEASPAPAPTALENMRRKAQALVEADRIEAAWATLQEARSLATASDSAYWLDAGNVAWLRRSRSDALAAYRTAWSGGANDGVAAERLIALYNQRGDPEQAMAVGREAGRRLGDVRWQLLEMDAAARAGQWGDVRALLAMAARDEQAYAGSAMYWLLVAYLAGHDGDLAAARAAYARALSVEPNAAAVKVQLLWFEIDKGGRGELGARLHQWQAEAASDPAFWRAYAVGTLRLGRVDESIAWFDKVARSDADDYAWMAGYADLLDAAGAGRQAGTIRAALLPALTASLASGARPPAEQRTLLLTQARLTGQVAGAAAGERALRALLDSGDDGADLFEALIGSCLAQKNYKAAGQLLRRAALAQRSLPAYLPLALALAEDDRAQIATLLARSESQLSVTDRVVAMRRLGRDAVALELAERSLREEDVPLASALRQHRDELKVQLAIRFEAEHEQRNVSDLRLARSMVSMSAPVDAVRWTLQLARTTLRTDGDALLIPGRWSENDIALLTELRVGTDPLRVAVGHNWRGDHSLGYGRLEWTHQFGEKLSVRGELAAKELTEETSALRVIGSKDSARFALSVNPGAAGYAVMRIAAQRFHTRGGDALGRGSKAEAEIGANLGTGDLGLGLRLSGSREVNRLCNCFPAALAEAMLAPSASLENVLSRRFETAGAGATLRFGRPESGHHYALLEGWIGRQWPLNELAYNARLSAGLALADNSRLKLEAFYTNVQGGVDSRPNRGVALWYQHFH